MDAAAWLTFREFVLRRQRVDSLASETADLVSGPGVVYPGGCYIEITATGETMLTLGNCSTKGPLNELEAALYRKFYLPEFCGIKYAGRIPVFVGRPVTRGRARLWARLMAEDQLAFHLEDDPADIYRSPELRTFGDDECAQLRRVVRELYEADIADSVFEEWAKF